MTIFVSFVHGSIISNFISSVPNILESSSPNTYIYWRGAAVTLKGDVNTSSAI